MAPPGIFLSLVFCGVAALNFIRDFDIIETGASQNAPKYMEWYAGLALMLSVVWFYLEALRLLSKLQKR